MSHLARPRIVVSRCLGFEACRWDGQSIACPAIDLLRGLVDFHPLCPEMDIGLGVPRLPINIVRLDDGERLLQSETGADLSMTMRDYAARTLAALGEVDGFILKSRSPSCGLGDVKLYADSSDSAAVVGRTSGLFAAAALARFPDLPIENEECLADPARRERFIERIRALAAHRRVNR
ncbi:MAG: DUF523 domain-containing protein [Candidatus Cloacimonetes bacterium]|nr:DUF523 domain-containing protein [Candidatus Cloacimonadota bacterium]